MSLNFDNTYVCLTEHGNNVEATVLFAGTYSSRIGGLFATDAEAIKRLPDRLMDDEITFVTPEAFSEQLSMRQDFMYSNLMPVM